VLLPWEPVDDGHARKQAPRASALAGEAPERELDPLFNRCSQSGFPASSVASKSARIVGYGVAVASLLVVWLGVKLTYG
jgi:hypothetical protein